MLYVEMLAKFTFNVAGIETLMVKFTYENEHLTVNVLVERILNGNVI